MTIAGGIIVAGFGMAIKTAKKFEQSMANTASVAGATAEELQTLSDYAREMGEQSVFSASEAADAMYYLASAGMDVEEIMGALDGTLALAAATQSDLAYTSGSVAASLSQFGLDASEADRIANVFAATISGSQATMEKLTTSMSYVGPMAHGMGMSIEDTAGILGKLYDAGIDGSKAGTALRMAFVKLLKPTEDGKAALEKLEVSITDSTGKMRPFVDIMADLEKAGMSTTDAMDIFGIRSGPAMMALVSQGIDSVKDLTTEITGTEKASEMAAMQIDTFEGAMKLLRSAWEEAQITLVNDLLPALKGLIGDLTEGVKKVTAWMKENPELVESFAKWGLAIGAVMLVLGPLLMALPGLTTLIMGLTSPIGLLVLAVAGVALAFKDWEKFKEIVTKVKDAVVGKIKEWASAIDKWWEDIVANTDNKWILFADKIKDTVVDVFSNAIQKISEWITTIKGYWISINDDADSWWNRLKEIVITAIEKIVTFITTTLPTLVSDISGWWQDILDDSDTTWEAIKTAILDIGRKILDELAIIIPNLVASIAGWWQDIIDDTDIKWLLVIDKIFGAIGNLIEWFAVAIGSWITDIVGYWRDIDSDADSWWNRINETIMEIVKDLLWFFWDTLPGLILDIIAWWEEIKGNSETIWEAIKTIIANIVQDIWDNITFILEPIVKFIKGLWDSIKGDTSTIWSGIESIISTAVGGIESVINGMITAIKQAWETAKGIYDSIVNMVENAPTIGTGGVSVSDIIEEVQSTPILPSSITVPVPGVGGVPWYDKGISYVPRTELAMVHKGEEINPPGQRSYDQPKNRTSSINIEAGAIIINTPRFNEDDAEEMFDMIERKAKDRGLKFVTD